MFVSSMSVGQAVEEDYDERTFVPLEQNISLESLSNVLLLDDTRTKNGRDFYEFFYQQWLSVQTDTTVISPTAFSDIGEELNVAVDEQPAPGGIGTSTVVSISVNDVMIYQQFLQPRQGVIELMAEDAIGALTQYIQNYQEFQKQLGSDDQMGSGIY
ncbi:CsgE family curli-type amyloid fiber assembly protein [Salmonirosea aquatica]